PPASTPSSTAPATPARPSCSAAVGREDGSLLPRRETPDPRPLPTVHAGAQADAVARAGLQGRFGEQANCVSLEMGVGRLLRRREPAGHLVAGRVGERGLDALDGLPCEEGGGDRVAGPLVLRLRDG